MGEIGRLDRNNKCVEQLVSYFAVLIHLIDYYSNVFGDFVYTNVNYH